MNQPLTTQDLARLLIDFQKYWDERTELMPSEYQIVQPKDIADWLIANDTSPNPHRYPNNPDLPQELDDNGPES